jgi:hypothetical protein
MTLLLLILVLVGVGVAVLLATADRPRRQIRRVIRDPDDRIDMLPPERTRRVRDERVERRRIIDS